MAKIKSQLEKDFNKNMELRAELSRMSYEATGGKRENYRNNENPNINLGGQEALQQFKKINPLTAEMIREYKEDEINKYKGEYIKPEEPDIEIPALLTVGKDNIVPTEETLYDIKIEVENEVKEANNLIETIKQKEIILDAYKAEYASRLTTEEENRVPPKQKRELRRYYEKYIKDLNIEIKADYLELNKLRDSIKKGNEIVIPFVIQTMDENKKRLQDSINKQKGAIYKYEEDLKQLNMNRLNVAKDPTENEFQYFERLKTIADTKHDEQFYKDKAHLEQVKKLKENMRKIIRNESMIEDVVKYLIETTNIFEINKYFTLIEEEFLKVFGYNNKNLTFNDIVKNILTILQRMGEVSITEEPNKEADTKPREIGDLITQVQDNRLIIGNKKNEKAIFIAPYLSGSKKEIVIFEEEDENPTRAVVADILKYLGISPTDLKEIIKSTTVPKLHDELISKFKLSPIVENISKSRGRPRKESMLEPQQTVEYESPVKTSEKKKASPGKLTSITEGAETIQEYERKIAKYENPINKPLLNVLKQASGRINDPSSNPAEIDRYLLMVKASLIDDPQNKLTLPPTSQVKKLISKVAPLADKAYNTKDLNDIVDANKEIEKIVDVIKKSNIQTVKTPSPPKTSPKKYEVEEIQPETTSLSKSQLEKPIPRLVKDAFKVAYEALNNPEANIMNISRAFMLIKPLIMDDPENKYVLLPTETNQKLVYDIYTVMNRAYHNQDLSDIVQSNIAIENLVNNIKGKIGSGFKKSAKKSVKKSVSNADKLRIKLIIGEIKSGNNNPKLLKEINKLKKKYSK